MSFLSYLDRTHPEWIEHQAKVNAQIQSVTDRLRLLIPNDLRQYLKYEPTDMQDIRVTIRDGLINDLPKECKLYLDIPELKYKIIIFVQLKWLYSGNPPKDIPGIHIHRVKVTTKKDSDQLDYEVIYNGNNLLHAVWIANNMNQDDLYEPEPGEPK